MLRQTSSACCPASVSEQAAPNDSSISAPAAPLDIESFSALIDVSCPVPAGAGIAVAVSGGGDSMALALLTDEWARRTGRPMYAVTVDHRLRPDSSAEAQRVGAWLAARGIAHDILAWQGDKPANGLQAAARAARYRLIGDWARMRGIRHVMLAHQLEDQAETFLMRLTRGSGIAGLAAMRGMSVRDGVRLCRPLLSVPRARLRATLRAAGQDWIEDPSNVSPRFARTGYRRLVAALEARDAGADRLAGLAHSFARLDALMDAAVRRFLGAAAVQQADGSVHVAMDAYAVLPEPVAATVLRRVLAEVGGRPLAPRSDRLARAQTRLTAPESGAAFTLGSCRIAIKRGIIRVTREGERRIAKDFPQVSGSFPDPDDGV